MKERPLDHKKVYELFPSRRKAGACKKKTGLGRFIVVVGAACGDHGLSPFVSCHVMFGGRH